MSGAALVLGLHLLTAHVGETDGMQTSTLGVYVQAANGATAGALRNSYGANSVYAGWSLSTASGRFALTAGAITGYQAARVLPLLVPSVRWSLGDGFSARASLLPKQLHGQASAGLHLSIERAL